MILVLFFMVKGFFESAVIEFFGFLKFSVRLLTVRAKMLLVAVLTTPDFAEPLGVDAGLVEGSKTLVTTVKFPLFAALKTMVIIEVIFIPFPLLNSNFLNCLTGLAGSSESMEFGGALRLCNHVINNHSERRFL